MIRFAVCDDEKCYVDEILTLIRKNIEPNLMYDIKTFYNGEELIKSLDNNIYDILFLDIEMNEISGLEVAKIIKSKCQNSIIFFITSHSNYVTDVFRLDSFQFLQKPIDYVDFKIDFVRAIKKYKKSHTCLELENNNSITKIMLGDIKYIEVISRKVYIHLINNIVIINGKLNYFEKKLKGFNFSKSNKSYLINLLYVKSLNNNNIEIKDEIVYIPLSRSYKAEFINDFHNYLQEVCL